MKNLKIFVMYNIIGFKIDDSYEWTDTLFLNDIAEEMDKIPDTCCGIITVKQEKRLSYERYRWIGDKMYIGTDELFDDEYGVRVKVCSNNEVELTVIQECNEWLIIISELLLLKNNYTFMHSAAVSKNSNVLLLPSWGGVGKTATVVKMLNKDKWKLLGDDLVITDGYTVYPFLKPFVLYTYHKELFPEYFSAHNTNLIKSKGLSTMLSHMLPSVKRILRHFPKLLALLRKNNPQSMRVSPWKLFDNEQLSSAGKANYAIWLERAVIPETQFKKISAKDIASKASAVSLSELFAGKSSAVFALCGCGLFNYQDIFPKIYNILYGVFENTDCYELIIPTDIVIDQVGDIVLKYAEEI